MAAMRTLGPKAAAALDEELMSTGAYSIDQLMELAGLSVSHAMYALSPPQKTPNVLVACGPGNNGGDGLVAARHLYHFGYKPTMYFPKQTKNELYQRLRTQLEHLKVPFTDDFVGAAKKTDYIIDAIFGFSFSGEVREPFPAVIKALAESKVPVLAVDAPSSWNIDEGPPKDGPGKDYNPDALLQMLIREPQNKNREIDFSTNGKAYVHQIRNAPVMVTPDLTKTVLSETCSSCTETCRYRITYNSTLFPFLRWALMAMECHVAIRAYLREQLRAHDEVGNTTFNRLLTLPVEIRQQIYHSILRRRAYITPFTRFDPIDLTITQICKTIRRETIPPVYGAAFFALDLRSEVNAKSAWRWLDGLVDEAIAAIRTLRLTTIVKCPCGRKCVLPVVAPVRRGHAIRQSGYTTQADAAMGVLKMAATISRACVDQPSGISVEQCGMCGDKPMKIAASIARCLDGIGLEDADVPIERQDLESVVGLMQSVSLWD
ncbi:hypothetical protein LTR97_005862 [Elasticomyces elasticus]|uniref:NAD(P)H-hydrate epimerase n=1 Tax=Elasticomyces elasticus TaxID=574655 RepID=A0AAN7W5Q8_9PEZI|nr:hypothetical protein LTR97_005862 [Elasticomyces elasticus]